MYSIYSINSFLIFSSNTNLCKLGILLSFRFLFIELLKLFSQFIGLLFLVLSMPSLDCNISFVSFVTMFIVIVSLFLLFLQYLSLIFNNFVSSHLDFILKFVSGLNIILLFSSIKIKLVLRVFNCIVDIVFLD